MHFHLTPVGGFTLEILDLTCSANLTPVEPSLKVKLWIRPRHSDQRKQRGKQAVPQDEAVAKVVVVAKVGIVD